MTICSRRNPRKVADRLCNVMHFDKENRRYIQDTFKRQVAGVTTRPDRIILTLAITLLGRMGINSIESRGRKTYDEFNR